MVALGYLLEIRTKVQCGFILTSIEHEIYYTSKGLAAFLHTHHLPPRLVNMFLEDGRPLQQSDLMFNSKVYALEQELMELMPDYVLGASSNIHPRWDFTTAVWKPDTGNVNIESVNLIQIKTLVANKALNTEKMLN